MEPLNYFRKAKPELLRLIPSMYEMARTIPQSSYYKGMADGWVDILNTGSRAVKFVLPTNGEIINDGLRGLDSDLKLPFPEVLLEYRIEKDGPSLAEQVFGTETTSLSKRRIVIARQETTGILLWSICHTHDTDKWGIMPWWIKITKRTTPKFMCTPSRLVVNNQAATIRDDIEIQAGIVGGLQQPWVPPNWTEYAQADMNDEIRALLELLEALSCSNVGYEKLPSRKFNKGAKKRNALPFDDYFALVVKSNKKPSEGDTNQQETDRRSPREHLRRGHSRTYASGLKIWVQSTVVNAGIGGVILKEYHVKNAA